MTPEFLLTALIVVLSPGTGVIYTISTGFLRGHRAALAAALGCTLGIIPHLLAAILGVAAILHSSALLFQLVKFAGVAFLLYMAWQTLRDSSKLSVNPDNSAPRASLTRTATRGTLINVLNPKLSIFFLAFLPQFLSGTPGTATSEMITLGAAFMVMTFLVFVLYGVFASVARRKVLENPRAQSWIRRIFAASFAGLGLKLAMEKA
ncbi:LysE family translocator [Halocynthiibacter styelae]|uniref:LysE family translocator n=1 Tax=Halocynthiibacter styelae TaxID=2761955 RepID=A0A8J7IUV0_9RHOB|nr:LysE family translocator [Paenihalocynthiibacter styelae]MBI1492903.1 LysE family translocator [Paenihalocynthiibacter styelae]